MMQFLWKNLKRDQKGFTLVELMVVVVILGILATLALQTVGNRAADARQAKAEADIRTVESALELYRLDTGSYPTFDTDFATSLSGLVTDDNSDGWDGPYIKALPTPPDGYTYVYASGGSVSFTTP